MKNYICYPLTPRVSTRFISKVKATSELTPGSIIIAETLENALGGNYETYTPKIATAADLGSKFFALVLNDGFETIEDGRRPAGQPDYFAYTFKTGEVAPILFLDNHMEFEIGADCVAESTKASAVVGNYLVPVAGSSILNAVSAIPSGTFVGLKILALKNTPIGGDFGGQFALSYVCTPIFSEKKITPTKYNLTVNQGEGTTLTIKRGDTVLTAGTGVLNAGDTLNITVTPESASIQINGEEYGHDVTYTVTGNTTVVSQKGE